MRSFAIGFGLLLVLVLVPRWPALAGGSDARWSSAFAPPGVASEVFAFAEFEGALIAGDERWTGAGWVRLGDGLDGQVYALTIFGGALVAAGEFRASGSVPLEHVARWNGASWEPMGSLPSAARALAVYDGQLYAGPFRWDGSAWTNVLQTDGTVYALEEYAGLLIAGGDFKTAGGLATPALVGWNGSALVSLGHSYTIWSSASDLTVHNGLIAAIGGFNDGGEIPPEIVTWDGTTWSTLLRRQWPDPSWNCVASWNGRLYVGGARGLSVEGPDGVSLGWYDGSVWNSGANGYGYVNTLYPTAAGLAVGGAFSNLGSFVSLNAAMWTDAGMSPLSSPGQGATNEIHLLMAEGDHLVAGGSFDAAGTSTAYRYGQWNGTTWSPACFEIGEVGSPIALAGGDGLLITSGQYQCGNNYFWLIGGGCSPFLDLGTGASEIAFHQSAFYVLWWNKVSRLDGASLTTLGGTTSGGTFFTMATSASGLLGGGDFDAIGSAAVKGVARWDGSAWQPLGSGLEGRVTALVEHAGAIYAGGSIDVSGGTPAFRVMRWDGAQWQALGGLFDGNVTCFASCAGDLYAGGSFQHVGGVAAPRIARWNGEVWEPLGSGLDGDVLVMQPFQDELYAGGRFHTAGGKPSFHFAAWNPVVVGVELREFAAVRCDAGACISWQMTGAAPGDRFRVLRSGAGEEMVTTGEWPSPGTSEFAVEDPQAPRSACDYWLEYIRSDGFGETRRYGPAHLEAATGSAPALALALHANVPNPFNPRTTFSFTLPREGAVRLSIYDPRGRLVARPVDAVLPVGEHQAEWDGRDRAGLEAPSGSYVARLETATGIRTRKVQLVR